MENNKDQIQRSQAGTGSAEQTGRDRDEQRLSTSDMSSSDKNDIASQIGESSDSITTINELGQMSGRDDAAGGSGDRMEGENTNEGTDRP